MDLERLRELASVCTSCGLSAGRNKPVFAKGNPESKILICGMVPADEENKTGLPFVGRAGQLLDRLLLDTNQTLNDVYITNLVKCYLAAGLPLKQEWIDACFPYIMVQIFIIKPKVILALGKDAAVSLLALDPKTTMSSIRGKLLDYSEGIKVIPTYHPSYLLRGGGANHKHYSKVLEDFLLAKNIAIDNV